MSDPQMPPGDEAEIDATGVDADFVTNDRDPEPDEATPGEGQTSGDDDEVDVADLP
ncbi:MULTISPECIES: hypothetical protein [Microbacterium]|jgi:hypothetical protein|uniref:hypothetical protein n=1 Tax=Microbacterium TaxID=33882 RepID=UPI002040C910|nr:hypothetical protein [Microbacterium hydrocarbonoxydans]MCM3779654.1 hypothetical protein [Microbacterium hydrocarbonoxydans]